MNRSTALLLILCFLGANRFAAGEDHVFGVPSEDQWQYPFNATPGSRPSGPVFFSDQSTFPGVFNHRDGVDIFSWETASDIPPGLPLSAYLITGCTVTLWNIPEASWALTGSNILGIPHRIELFAVGFGPTYTEDNYSETIAYIGGSPSTPGAARDPYPIHRLTGDAAEDATDTADISWALGTPIGYTPDGMTEPFPVVFSLDTGDPTIQEYLQEELSRGRMDWMVTCTIPATQFSGVGPIPNLITKEGDGSYAGDQNPRLELAVTLDTAAGVSNWMLLR